MKAKIDLFDFLSDENAKTLVERAKENRMPPLAYAMILLDTYLESGSKLEKAKEEAPEQEEAPEPEQEEEEPEEVSEPEREEEPEPEPEEEGSEGEEEPEPKREGTPMQALDLPTRGQNALVAHGVGYVDEIEDMTREELFKVPNIGKKTMGRMLEIFEERGIELRDPTKAEEVVEEAEESPEDLAKHIMEMDPTRDNVVLVARMWCQETKQEREEAIKLMREEASFSPGKPDTFKGALVALANNLPITEDQISDVYAIANRLGETKKHAVQERPQAMAGKDLRDLTYGEANQLISEMSQETDSGEDFFNDLDEGFFDE